jgi:hypothetical protein
MKNRNFIEGVNIIAKYIPEERMDKFDLCAGHDQIWFCPEDIVTEEGDRQKLVELGWMIEEDSWSAYT